MKQVNLVITLSIFMIGIDINSATQTDIYNRLALNVIEVDKKLAAIENKISMNEALIKLAINIAENQKIKTPEKRKKLQALINNLLKKQADFFAERVRLLSQYELKNRFLELAEISQ